MQVTFLESQRTTNGSIDFYGGLDADSLIYVSIFDRQHSEIDSLLESCLQETTSDRFPSAPAIVNRGQQKTYRLDRLASALQKRSTDTWLSDDLRSELLLAAYQLKAAMAKRK